MFQMPQFDPSYRLPNSQNVLAQRMGMMPPRPQMPMQQMHMQQPPMNYWGMQPRPIAQPMPPQIAQEGPGMGNANQAFNPMQNFARQRMMGRF